MSHYYLGTAYYKSDFYEEAESSLQKAFSIDPTFVGTRVMLVNVYLKQKRLKDALAQIDAFIKEHPKAEERRAMEDLRQKVVKGIETP
jgi:tetratricopeptide (TPR) repeat protein